MDTGSVIQETKLVRSYLWLDKVNCILEDKIFQDLGNGA